MSELSEYLLPFDPSAELESNYLQGESYAISSPGQTNYQQIVLRQGAFYLNDFKIIHQASSVELKENVDYILSYFCREVYDVTDTYAFGAIVLINKSLYGTLLISARFIGGDYGLPPDNLIPAIIDKSAIDDTYIWEDVQDIPPEYPVNNHQISTKLLTEGFDDMVDVLVSINETIGNLGKIQDGITIDWVEGLQEALDGKIENNGISQINRVAAALTYPGYIELVLPELIQVTKLAFTLDVATKDNIFTFSVQGDVSAGIDTSPWDNTFARIFGSQRNFNIFTGYKDSRPVVYIGPFSEASSPDKLLAVLRHYIIDGKSEEFSADFELNMVTAPVGYTNVTNRYLANDHQHEIAAINGLQEWITGTEETISSNAQAIQTNAQGLSSTNQNLSNLSQQHSDDMETVSNAIEGTNENLSNLTNDYTQFKEDSVSKYNQIETNKTGIATLVSYLAKTEDCYQVTTGSTLVFNNTELDTTKSYIVTLVGSSDDGDVYQALVRYRSTAWSAVVITMGSETPTTPVLVIQSNTIAIRCFDSNESDDSVVVSIRCIDTAASTTA